MKNLTASCFIISSLGILLSANAMPVCTPTIKILGVMLVAVIMMFFALSILNNKN